MKSILILLLTFCLSGNLMSCNKGSDFSKQEQEKLTSQTMKITIGTEVFTVTLSDNATAKAFRELLPLTLNMSELNNNEKYADLPKSLPTNATNPKTIQNGDLMLFGSRTLVLFYATFSTSYSYTSIGKVSNPEKLSQALGTGNVSVVFSLE